VPERVVRAERRKQFVQIDEVAEAPVEVGVEEQVYGGVQHAVDRRKHADTGIAMRFRGGPESFGIGPQPAHRRTDRVMNVQCENPPRILERRDLVRPLAVIALVVWIEVGRAPAGGVQQLFRLGKAASGNHDVDIRQQARRGMRHSTQEVGDPFQRDHGNLHRVEHAASAIELPSRQLGESRRGYAGGQETVPRNLGQLVDHALRPRPFAQIGEDGVAASAGQHPLPTGGVQPDKRRRIANRLDQCRRRCGPAQVDTHFCPCALRMTSSIAAWALARSP